MTSLNVNITLKISHYIVQSVNLLKLSKLYFWIVKPIQ